MRQTRRRDPLNQANRSNPGMTTNAQQIIGPSFVWPRQLEQHPMLLPVVPALPPVRAGISLPILDTSRAVTDLVAGRDKMRGTSARVGIWCRSSNRRGSAQGEQPEFSPPSLQAPG